MRTAISVDITVWFIHATANTVVLQERRELTWVTPRLCIQRYAENLTQLPHRIKYTKDTAPSSILFISTAAVEIAVGTERNRT